MRRLSAMLASAALLGVLCLAPAPASAMPISVEEILRIDESVKVPSPAGGAAARLDLEEVYQFDEAPERPNIVLQMHYHV